MSFLRSFFILEDDAQDGADHVDAHRSVALVVSKYSPRAAQPKVESYVYMGAQHGFGCDERGSFSQPDYELAQQRTLAFFAKHLG